MILFSIEEILDEELSKISLKLILSLILWYFHFEISGNINNGEHPLKILLDNWNYNKWDNTDNDYSDVGLYLINEN